MENQLVIIRECKKDGYYCDYKGNRIIIKEVEKNNAVYYVGVVFGRNKPWSTLPNKTISLLVKEAIQTIDGEI